MQTIRMLMWTAASVALGIAMATVPVAGQTPWERLKSAWSTQVTAARVESVRGAVHDAIGGSSRPRERHSAEEKRAVSQLVAERAKPAAP